jgi:hypothetical protein
MAATFDLWQQSYIISKVSGSLGLAHGTPAALAHELAKTLDNFYLQNKSYIGPWSTAWGPVVFEHQPGTLSVADNAMFVAVNGDQSAYLVGIAGTNAASKYDMQQEDEDVSNTVAWASAFPSLGHYGIPSSMASLNPYLAAGTVLGVNNLLGMQDGNTQASLIQFLASLTASGPLNAQLIFSGHSLGGALAPTLALALFNPAGGPLDLSKWLGVYHYPTAGPTPGNQDFTTFLATEFTPSGPGSQQYQVWNQNVCNTLDIVPQAWMLTTLAAIPAIYPSPWQQDPQNAPQKLLNAVANAISESTQGGQSGLGAYVPIANQQLPGTFDTSIPVTDYDSFKAQALHQHIGAYDTLLNVTSISSQVKSDATYTSTVDQFLTKDVETLAKETAATT